jgi:hypothetical protein
MRGLETRPGDPVVGFLMERVCARLAPATVAGTFAPHAVFARKRFPYGGGRWRVRRKKSHASHKSTWTIARYRALSVAGL